MKRIHFTTKLISITLASCLFASCSDVIFSTIRDEVKLESAQVSGDINSIVRYTSADGHEYLYLDNGNIWRKSIDKTTTTIINADGSTKEVSTNNPTTTAPYNGKWIQLPQTGMVEDHVIHLAADSTTLYALAGLTGKDSDTGYNVSMSRTLYSSSDGGITWTTVPLPLGEGVLPLNLKGMAKIVAKLFCTNAPQKEHRKAYIRITNTLAAPYYSYVYELSGGTATQITDFATADLSDKPTGTSSSCAYFNGKVYFSSTAAMTTNETATTDATYIYNALSNTAITYSTDATTWLPSVTTGLIYSMSFTATHLLVGTADGLIYIQLDTTKGNIPKEKVSFLNTGSTLSSYYRVFNVVAVDASMPAISCDTYATAVFSGSTSSTGASADNIGLWAYYPGRLKWNRE